MSRKFYAINRETGERWKPDKTKEKHFLVMYDSGYLAEVESDGWYTYISTLDPSVWRKVENG